MSKKQNQCKPQPEMGFVLEIDGKQYGPFREKQRKSYKSLANRKGVRFLPKLLTAEALSLSLSLSLPKQKDASKSIPLFSKG